MKLTGDSGSWRLGHRPALDGLRAIAVLLVVPAHFDTGQFTLGGVAGVTMFFTLSGFLITSLLLEERTRTGRVSWSGFYRRRALRLLPALAVMVAVVCALTAAGLPTDVGPGIVASIVGYGSNWYLTATAFDGEVFWTALGHTWSLAIEEQFYLVWPLVLLLAARFGRRGVLATASFGAVASLVWWIFSDRSNLNTDISAYALLVGCALAAWMSGRETVRVPWGVPVLALAPLAALIATDAQRVAHVVVPLLTAAAIFAAVQVEVRWLMWAPLQWVGRRSYGLYLWHFPVAHVMFFAAGSRWVVVPLSLALSFALTALSWRFIEQPFLRLKDRRLRLSADDTVRTRRGYEPVRRSQTEGVVAGP